MCRHWVFRCTTVALSLLAPLVGWAQQPPTGQASPSQSATGQEGCKAYLAIAPIDQDVMELLSTPVVPANQTGFSDTGVRQLRDWDLPPKVTAWQERPSPQELARRWEELNQGRPALSMPYTLQPLPARDWQDLEKWFAKDAPKKLSGVCVGQSKIAYILAIGVISDGSGDNSLSNASARNEYNQTSSARREDSNTGPNAASVPSVAQNRSDEFSGMGGDSFHPGSYTCAFFFHADDASGGRAGKRRATPDYYYCKANGIMPKSAATTMLKYLSKAGIP